LCVGSDAHDATLVGVFDRALELLDEMDFDDENIVNRDTESVLDFLKSRGKKDIPFE